MDNVNVYDLREAGAILANLWGKGNCEIWGNLDTNFQRYAAPYVTKFSEPQTITHTSKHLRGLGINMKSKFS